jgi:hypothetical protein
VLWLSWLTQKPGGWEQATRRPGSQCFKREAGRSGSHGNSALWKWIAPSTTEVSRGAILCVAAPPAVSEFDLGSANGTLEG